MPRVLVRALVRRLSCAFVDLFVAVLLLGVGVGVVVLFLAGAVVAPVVTDVRVEGGDALAEALGEGAVGEVGARAGWSGLSVILYP